MPRTNAAKVKAILLDQFDEDDADSVLDPFIKFANLLVTRVCAVFDDYDEDYLTEIESWLSAHAYKVVKRQEIREEAGSVKATYEGKVDLRLQVTEFGQQAMVLDVNGGLAGINNSMGEVKKKVKVGITWLGTPVCG